MNSPDPRRFSRREALKYGFGGAAGLAVPLVAKALPAAATSRLRAAASARPSVEPAPECRGQEGRDAQVRP